MSLTSAGDKLSLDSQQVYSDRLDHTPMLERLDLQEKRADQHGSEPQLTISRGEHLEVLESCGGGSHCCDGWRRRRRRRSEEEEKEKEKEVEIRLGETATFICKVIWETWQSGPQTTSIQKRTSAQGSPLLASLPLPGRPLQPQLDLKHLMPFKLNGSSPLSLFPNFNTVNSSSMWSPRKQMSVSPSTQTQLVITGFSESYHPLLSVEAVWGGTTDYCAIEDLSQVLRIVLESPSRDTVRAHSRPLLDAYQCVLTPPL
ncbi:Zinc finger protein 385C [Takifugu flavidus]|uniref:Zinc finger protein 385C n=1 Tax=Takifugu flavidus TaxID=433684 RepID=A0A5C6NRP9_9TELE|nr:Zinc finger protein 385C [Takifugu flavidus]